MGTAGSSLFFFDFFLSFEDFFAAGASSTTSRISLGSSPSASANAASSAFRCSSSAASFSAASAASFSAFSLALASFSFSLTLSLEDLELLLEPKMLPQPELDDFELFFSLFSLGGSGSGSDSGSGSGAGSSGGASSKIWTISSGLSFESLLFVFVRPASSPLAAFFLDFLSFLPLSLEVKPKGLRRARDRQDLPV